jgi:hypothetical protein
MGGLLPTNSAVAIRSAEDVSLWREHLLSTVCLKMAAAKNAGLEVSANMPFSFVSFASRRNCSGRQGLCLLHLSGWTISS